jgi:hypothetical protein
MKMNKGIQVKEAESCLLCSNEWASLYHGLRDRLFGAPGTWTLMRCPKCSLVWLNPHPVTEDIGKLYENYSTHYIVNHVPRFASVRKAIRDSVLASSLGYNSLASGPLQKGPPYKQYRTYPIAPSAFILFHVIFGYGFVQHNL